MKLIDTLVGKMNISKRHGLQKNTEVNNVIILLDNSPSMVPFVDQVRELANEWIGSTKLGARTSENTDNYLTVATFSGYSNIYGNNNLAKLDFNTLAARQFPEAVQLVGDNYDATGDGTAIIDALTRAISNSSNWNFQYNVISTLIILITDGEDNQSRSTGSQLKTLLSLSPDVSIAILCPPGHTNTTHHMLGIPKNNIAEWEQSKQGIIKATELGNRAIGNYYSTRAAGQTTSSTLFLEPKLTSKKLDSNLEEVTNQFLGLAVPNSLSGWEISTFVQHRIASNIKTKRKIGSQYIVGNAYYQLVKPETIQSQKDILIEDTQTGKLYTGDLARKLVGLPSAQAGTKVKANADRANRYQIYIRSTSTNRKLVGNTTLYYKVK